MNLSVLPAHLPRVLVVDDDPALCGLLADYLGGNGFDVRAVGDASGMREVLSGWQPDAVVMDLMLPGEDGLSLTRFLKAKMNVPVLILSARGDEMDRVIGLEVGADDYLPKPFGPRELLARLRALLRRPRQEASGSVSQPSKPAFGPYQLDTMGQRLLRNGQDVGLSGAEYQLLVDLMANPGRVLSRDWFIQRFKGYDRDPFDRSIDTRVTRLRRKIEADPSQPRYIRTVRGEGYLFNPNGDTA